MCVALSILSPVFLTTPNLINVIRQISINGILATGMTFIILTGGIDLSVGSQVAFTGAIVAG
ncbi:MAG TPA: ribose ABC transporter permease, partial [Firmicutes bacterium]|nr:ribose ABC transporter permease [Bacillota bacterium]